jgi:RNA polymerase sigma factor (sigma-70 family)
MAGLQDEQLVALVQECGCVPARDELITRYSSLKNWLIHRRAAQSGLQDADRMDAQQDAVLWILEAIRAYDTGQQFTPRGCHFRSFLYHVLLLRFTDLLRRRGRRQARLRIGGYTFGSLSLPSASQRNHAPASTPETWDGDPERGMERKELMARVEKELDRLGGRARQLWDLLMGGMRLRQIAAALDLSYDAVKRQRRKLIAHLRACLDED